MTAQALKCTGHRHACDAPAGRSRCTKIRIAGPHRTGPDRLAGKGLSHPGDTGSMEVIATRFYPPQREGRLVPRERLQPLLERIREHRLVLIKAPAGYGKSTLMADIYRRFEQAGEPVVWLSMHDLDGSVEELALYLVKTLQRAVDGFGQLLESMLSGTETPSARAIGVELVNAFARLDRPVAICLDDLHAVIDAPAEKLMATLLHDAPCRVRFIMSTRSIPGFGIARLHALGELMEIGADQLRFSEHEARGLLALAGHDPVPDDVAALMVAKTEGWAAALQLLSLALDSGQELGGFLQSFRGTNREIASFLAEDVFNRQPAEVQEFLLRTCILNRFCAELCDAVGECDDSRQRIEQLERSSLFLFSLDPEGRWFRYHHLFEEFLQRRLLERSVELKAQYHLRAGRWFVAHQLNGEAFAHLIAAGDMHGAAGILDEQCVQLIYRGQGWSMMGWVAQIPEEVLQEYVRTQLARAWWLVLEWRFDEARPLIEGVEQRLQRAGQDGSIAPALLRQYRALLLHRKMMLAQFADDMPATERLTQELMRDTDESDPYFLGTLEVSLLYAQREQYRLADVDRLAARAVEFFRRSGSDYVLVWHESIVGPTQFLRGQLDDAIDGYRRAIAIASRIRGHRSGLTAMPSLLLAEVLLERGELDEVRTLLDEFLPIAGEVGFVDQLIAGYITQARLAEHDGDPRRADAALREGYAFSIAKSFDRLHWHVIGERIRGCLRHGDVAGAVRLARSASLPESANSLLPGNQSSPTREAMAVAWARLAGATGRAAEAASLLRRWLAFTESRGCMRSQIRLGVLLARCHLAQDDGRAALRAMEQAARLAAPIGMRFSFGEEGAAVFDLYQQIAGQIEGAPTTSSHPSMPLGQREIAILRLVAKSLLNKEIGDRLGLTEGSVKWYLQQIYEKLGVRRRLQAVQKAEQLGYL